MKNARLPSSERMSTAPHAPAPGVRRVERQPSRDGGTGGGRCLGGAGALGRGGGRLLGVRAAAGEQDDGHDRRGGDHGEQQRTAQPRAGQRARRRWRARAAAARAQRGGEVLQALGRRGAGARPGEDIEQLGARQWRELGSDLAGPCAGGLVAAEIGAGPQTLRHAGLLGEQVVADLDAPLGCQLARLARREHREGGVGSVVHCAFADAQQRSHLGVALVLTQQKRQRRALVGW